MTKQQMSDKIKQWNVAQGKEYRKMETEYNAIHEKYFLLNGSASCSFVNFIIEISNCDKVTAEERAADINKIVNYHKASGRWSALNDLISVL